MGKTRDLFKKMRATKGTFHAKMGSIKDRNSKDIKEAEEIRKRWQEYTELYRKGLNDLNNDNDVVTQLEKVSLHFNSKEGQCQRMIKLPRSCTHFTC